MSMGWENRYPRVQFYGVEDFIVEDYRLRLKCERRFQAYYLWVYSGEC